MTPTKQEQKHIDTIWSYYKTAKRDLPWRNTKDVYRILVSEIMLQQTQVSRVLIKYEEFLTSFPDFYTLARASNTNVLKVWKGLGYNRRAFFLKRIAAAFVELEKQGITIQNPKSLTYQMLLTLPGIGQSTAGAVMAFAHNIGIPFIETNIRTIYLAHFFAKKEQVTDMEILRKIEKILSYIPKQRYRDWYYALYDYGSMLKFTQRKNIQSVHKQSASFKKQSTFIGSQRQLRAHILHTITDSMPQGIAHKLLTEKLEQYILSVNSSFANLKNPKQKITHILDSLKKEQHIVSSKSNHTGGQKQTWYIS